MELSNQYLLFRLYGAMSSWGEIAVGENRHTANHPSKSAVIGLTAAALGIDRSDDVNQQAFANTVRIACKVPKVGSLLRDYHTAQAPDSVGKFKYRTRRDEIVAGKMRLGTVLSSREYRTDAQAIIAISIAGNCPYSLEQIKGEAKVPGLLKPQYHLYLGRKACPLAAPLNPQIINAKTLKAAFDVYEPGKLIIGEPEWNNESRWLNDDTLQGYYWEGEVSDFSEASDDFDPAHVQLMQRYDQPLSRKRWQFMPRAEFYWSQQQGGA